jgi:hypothetical protein
MTLVEAFREAKESGGRLGVRRVEERTATTERYGCYRWDEASNQWLKWDMYEWRKYELGYYSFSIDPETVLEEWETVCLDGI